jgi:hypothetical protein
MDTPQKKNWIPMQHPWRWRLIVGGLMFLLAFIGVGLTVIEKERSWDYWRLLSILFAALSLGLSAYLKHYKWQASLVTVWHEIFHWLGLVLAIGILSNMVYLGLLSPFVASLQALVLLSLATFLAGVYIEKTFLFIGGLLGCFALVLSYISLYTYLLFIPIALMFVLGFYFFIRKKSHEEVTK